MKKDVEEKEKNKFSLYFIVSLLLFVTSIIVYGLAVFWHPFGEPWMEWHIANAVVSIVLFFITTIFYMVKKGIMKWDDV